MAFLNFLINIAKFTIKNILKIKNFFIIAFFVNFAETCVFSA